MHLYPDGDPGVNLSCLMRLWRWTRTTGPGQVVSDKRCLEASAFWKLYWMKLAFKERLPDTWRKVEYCCGHNNGSQTMIGG